MQNTETTPLLPKKGHAHVYIWISNNSRSTSTSDINSISSVSEFGHVALRLFDEKGEEISYADHGYISLYPSPEKNIKFIFKSQFQDFGSGSVRTPPNKTYKISQIDVRAIQEEFKKIKNNNNITYSPCLFNGKGKFNCSELILNLLVIQGKASSMLRFPYSFGNFHLDLNEALISVSENHNNKIVHALSNSCSALLLCGILVFVAVGVFAVISSIIADSISLSDPAYVEYKRYCESDIPRNLLLNADMEYNCSSHVRPKVLTNKQLDIIEIMVGGAAFLGFLIVGFLICQHWTKSIKNAIVITPDSINDLFNSVASPKGLINEEKNMAIRSGPPLLSIQIDNPLSSSHNTLISSRSSSNNKAEIKEETKNLFSLTK